MRALLIRKGNVPEVINLRDTSLLEVARALGAAHIHGHALDRRAENGNLILACYAGPGQFSYHSGPLESRRPVLIASTGPYDDLNLSTNDVYRICADVVLREGAHA